MNVTSRHFKDFLTQELERRRSRNRRYSLRSFAKTLGVDGSDLSRVLQGKTTPSIKMSKKIVTALALPDAIATVFYKSVAQARKESSLDQAGSHDATPPAEEIDQDVYDRVSEWFHLAILELTYVKDFKSDPKWIGRTLGITTLEARRAIADLKYAHLLIEIDGRLEKVKPRIANKDRHTVSSAAVRRQLRQVFALAEASVERFPIEERCTLGLTVPIDETKMPDVKRLAEDFVNELCKHVVAGSRTRVYQLALGFFPLQRKP